MYLNYLSILEVLLFLMTSTKKIEVMIADDHNIFRKALKQLLNQFENITVVAEAENGIEALNQLKHTSVDIILTDLSMPSMDGFGLLKHLQKEQKNIKVIILTMYKSDQLVSKLILGGACGFLKKNCEVDELVTTIEKVHSDGYYFYPESRNQNLPQSCGVKDFNEALKDLQLSDREIEILRLVCADKTNQQIADMLNIKVGTVDFHKKNIYKKTGNSSNIGLLKFAIKNGLDID